MQVDVASASRTRPATSCARSTTRRRRSGIELVFATDRCHQLDDPWQDRAIPVRFYDLEPSLDADRRRAPREFLVDGVLAVGDRPVVLAARAARGAWAAVAFRRRRRGQHRQAPLARRAAAAGLPSPRFVIAMRDPRSRFGDRTDSGAARDRAIDFPVVLKPVGLSGSRGVIRVERRRPSSTRRSSASRALLARPADARGPRRPRSDEILVEGYVDGDEFAARRCADAGRAARVRDLRQARSARRARSSRRRST